MKYPLLILFLGIFLSIGLTPANAQIFPKIIKKSNSETTTVPQERRNIELRAFDQDAYLQSLSTITDSLIFENNVNLRKSRSIIAEDQNLMIWAPTNRLIKVSEQIQIDSIWVTAFEYYANWDSKKVDIYNFDVRNFQDTVNVRLYDPFFGYQWKMPTDIMKINSSYGPRWGRMHYGTDLDLNTGDPIYAGFDGIVRVRSYDRYGYGNFLVVRHKNGLETLYGHMSKLIAQVGDEVKAGDIIGKGGSTGRSTGPHLHYELRYRGLAFDPELVYDFPNGKIKFQDYQITPGTFNQVVQARTAAYHRVKRGDTLGGIARRYGVSVSTLTRLNRISTRTILRIGQNLRVR